jgi:hypothetical protein
VWFFYWGGKMSKSRQTGQYEILRKQLFNLRLKAYKEGYTPEIKQEIKEIRNLLAEEDKKINEAKKEGKCL